MIKTQCSVCKKIIFRWPYQLRDHRPCCSILCWSAITTKRGKDNHFYKNALKSFNCQSCQRESKEYASRIILNRGKFCSKQCMIYYKFNPKSFYYKGGGYSGTHKWLVRKYGKADRCQNRDCLGISKIYEWANLDDKYLRDITTWAKLCKKCHHLMDCHSLNYDLIKT